MAIRFSELRKHLSRVGKISLCFMDGSYKNYIMPDDIPEKYNEMYVFGIGMVDVEFPHDIYAEPGEMPGRCLGKEYYLGAGLEIVLQESPRDISRMNEEQLTFADLRNYLQIGRGFSIVVKEEWQEECYVYRDEIPDTYNDLYVYGISLTDNAEELIRISTKYKIIDTALAKRLRVVVSREPSK